MTESEINIIPHQQIHAVSYKLKITVPPKWLFFKSNTIATLNGNPAHKAPLKTKTGLHAETFLKINRPTKQVNTQIFFET